MKAYIVSLAAGVAVGLLYNVIDVKSPAPPIVALIGLLGMVAGEHAIPFARTVLAHVTS
jgi:XapX domain-containing protein